MKLNDLQLNERATEGRWVTIHGDFRCSVRPLMLPAYKAHLAKLQREHPVIGKVSSKDWAEETFEEFQRLLVEAFVDVILETWEGLEDFPHSRENAIEILTNKRTSYLFQLLIDAAAEIEPYLGDLSEDERGNSESG